MNWKKILICMCALLVMVLAVIRHREISEAILSAGKSCVTVIIPSLYMFSVLSALLVRSGILEMLAVPLDRFSRKFLRMDGTLLVVILYAQIAGYPVGAQLLRQMQYKYGMDVRTMLCVCFGCGPAFLLGTVCALFRTAQEIAVLMLLSMAIPNLLAAVIIARRNGFVSGRNAKCCLSLTAADVTASVESGAAAMLKICSMILVFSAGMALISTGIQNLVESNAAVILRSMAAAILEISNITEYLQNGGSLPAAAALLSFGGICVHLQNAAIYGADFPWRQFWTVRILCALCTGFLCRLGLSFFYSGQLQQVFLPQPACTPELTSEGVIPVLCLMIMSVMVIRKRENLRT